MMYKLSHIAQAIQVDFDGIDIDIEGIHTLTEASASQLSFFNTEKYLDQLPHTKAAAVLIQAKYAHLLPQSSQALITDEPYLKLALASKLFAYKLESKAETPTVGNGCDIDSSVRFGKNVTLGDDVTLLAGCYVGDHVTIDSGTLLHPNVTVYHHTRIGKRCIIHSGTVVGCDGYGFAHTKQGEHIKIHQNGNVIVEDDVEIGANCTVDRAVFGTTYIRRGTKLDNLIQIGHNCDVGEHTLCAAQVGLAGSTVLGRNVVMGGQSGTAGHLKIGDFATIAGKSGVTKSLEGGKTYAGFPAIEHKLWLRLQAKIAGLLKRQ
ncbi:MAG TPA: UDP-3-O-(3-hydroxymyristoyl)glucosamine N-acyltransferase [Sulfurovum sp.]|nr:MAG: UDP-3-O-(3-hydroxymyristoyl)glucosamine N-acyltransferase [Sulfurovum sp. 35-42-20]OYY57273.1 MAG: UDP-3-O-(3-hydroxymyristoyl)glucosamine N-acyltransferase [Sulfurovum sp. 28-43-6]OYZ50143.1 MAG: UDP-3-O-(3-hydroxymyristoyl)glucosamine N-acyltransferase [Sulfurovum sp. 24-42-9]OZA44315.1 MAG: UDP-3-O-(3-hydroxymyristoyl)glucosamine N-acyltransferase [Sulfurovum sp. 17-42-90]OZA60051.1 MAG: UDP-3-O-(3-hydroxymyristoyl)glucosamine N-acyltransferase [Sulfurovum sp. 39-42-12]HQR73088.1 UD